LKLQNRFLYYPHGIELFDDLIGLLKIKVNGLSRLDICLDFNRFYNNIQPDIFIKDYLSGIYRHVGRTRGNAYFRQKTFDNTIYTGLSFGSHESDARTYLYNKTYELKTVKDKPYIRDKWKAAGLDITRDVWRLEISLKSSAMKFNDKETSQPIHITYPSIKNWGNVSKIFYTFANSLFAFVRYRDKISNISREPRLQLLPPAEHLKRWIIRPDIEQSTVADKITIKRLWLAENNYKMGNLITDASITKSTAAEIAYNTDLGQWLSHTQSKWIEEIERERKKMISV
jgi:hypothetical protein